MHWMKWSKMCKSKWDGGMGFCDARLFNQALLACQCWRLLKFPHSLVFWVLKAKYFPNEAFMNAKVPNNASFTWRSIMWAQLVIEKGTRWRVGDGADIHIWKDRWLPSPTTFKVITPVSGMLRDAKVSELITQDPLCWNLPLIDSLFMERDTALIENLPLSFRKPQDSLIWNGSTKGLFSVKNAYYMLKQENQTAIVGESSSTSSLQGVWKAVWSLQVRRKYKSLFGKHIMPFPQTKTFFIEV
jgi:hypothetical protein